MDAIAAGGGLAGAAFAFELARHGARAMVVERTGGPHHKVCGEFLSDKAQTLLCYLGLDPQGLGASAVETLRLVVGARTVTARLPFRAFGVSRLRLDEALLHAAAETGVEIIRSTLVDNLYDRGEDVLVRTSRGEYTCRAVALATGKHNIRGVSRPTGPMVGFKLHVHPSPATRRALAGVVQLVGFRGGYIGFCLVEDGVLSIAWNVRREILRAIGSGWDAQSAYIAKQSSVFGDLTSGAELLWAKPLAVSGQPYGFLRSQPIAPRVYPVGDQLAVIPSFAGDGTALALASGTAAARAVLKGETAIEYQSRLIDAYKPQFRRAVALDTVIAHPLLRRAGLMAARASPGLVTTLVAATRLRGFDDVTGQGPPDSV